MVSRRKILSRSRDDLNVEKTYMKQIEDEEDVWYHKEKLFNVSAFEYIKIDLRTVNLNRIFLLIVL